ncbi:MAG: peptidoglycan DD-metalloendopeptidase family protein [Blastomonas fulva]|uniref:peptidoglycan DD-metalloendopeptidase family protein n=1 Tax=Blastomonas fulva TaxID=1550728 RepID=UPI004034AC7C
MSNEFPAFIKAEYVEGDAFSRFQRDVSQTLAGTQQRFERSFAEIGSVINKAISRPAGAGRIDLGLPDFRQAAAEARAYQASIEATLGSAKTLAQLTGDVSAQTRSYIQALTAQNAEARQAVAAADAQVTTYTRLQTALNATADANSRLAVAQREVYAEQARAAQIEVQQRRRQEGLNQVFAPGLTSRATDNGAGFGALQDLVQQQAAAEQAAASLLALKQAEAGAAEGARILSVALQGTALEAGRTSKSARESAAAFEAAFAAQERSAREAAAAQQALAASAAQLRSEIDPMFAAQQRFNAALDRADELFRAGTISTREYEQAQAQARQQLQAHAQSLFQVETAQGRGTSATRINTESQRANRFAMIQAGQQLQDITISLQSGQRATTVFAQQLPQLAFAFTDVGGKVGAFAQFLAGPYGVIVFGAITALGFLAEGYFSAGDEATKAKTAVQSLGDGIDFQKKSVDELINSIEELLKVQQKEIRSSKEAEQAKRADADAALLAAQNNLSYAISLLEVTKAKNADTRSARDPVSGDILYGLDRQLETALNSQIKSLSDALKRAEELSRGASIAPAERAARRRADPEFNVTERFADLEQAARNRRRAGTITERQLEDEIVKLTRAREAELKVVRETQKATRGVTDPGETTRFLSPITGTQSAPFGQQRGNRRHAGVDIAAPVGSAVRAPADGTIIEIGNDPGGYGNYVVIDHGRGTKTRYAHLLQTTRSKGSSVSTGEVFARSGGAPGAPGSGNSRGAHLHYEVLRNGKAVDPMKGLFPTDSLKVAQEAEQVLEKLAGQIQSLQGRFNPATKAANDFAEALATIKEAEGAGIISERQSFDLQISAMAEQAGRIVQEQNAAVDRFMRVFEPQQMRGAAEEYADVLEDRWASAQNSAANAFVDALTTVDFLQALIRGRANPIDILRTINPNDSRLRTGAGSGESGVSRFLFGRASSEIEIARGKSPIQGGFAQEYTKVFTGLKDAFSNSLEKVLGKDASKIGGAFGKVFAGAEVGSMTHDLIEGFGIKTSKLGSQIGGALGSVFGPIGSLIGSIVVGAGVEALKPAKRGSATIGGLNGNLVVSSSRGNSRARVERSVETADEAITTLERIADALGARLDTSKGSVSIGVRGDNFRVDTSGRGITKTKKGAVDFGDDSAAAIRFATMDLIKDGVIQGLRASTQRVLQSSKDLDTAIQRAVDFEGVFQQLKERKDPVGAAVDAIEKEFARLRDIFVQAGASVEEYASLEELYGLKRTEAVKQATEEAFGSMKELLDDLRFGDNGRSLRDRLAAAQAKFDPLAARVEAGDTTAYDDFADAARALLDIQRQFSGSQTAFFELQDRITAITARVVEGGNVASILPGGANSAQADAARSFDGSNVVSAIDRQTAELSRILTQIVGGELRAINDNTTGGGSPVSLPGFAQLVQQI